MSARAAQKEHGPGKGLAFLLHARHATGVTGAGVGSGCDAAGRAKKLRFQVRRWRPVANIRVVADERSMNNEEVILQVIRTRFPTRAVLTPGEALSFLPGMRPAGLTSAANQRIQRGTFPFPVEMFAGRRGVRIGDIVRVLAGESSAPDVGRTATETSRRGPGRPRKLAPVPVTERAA